jgi:hypothetical protein
MKVHHYDEDYAKRMKTDGRRELNLTLLVGFVVFIIPIVLITLGTISQLAGFLIIGAGIIVFSISLNRSGIFTKASCCVIIEYNNKLYYMMLNPNLDQCLLDKAVFKSVNFDTDVTVFFEDAYYQPVSDDDKFIFLLFTSSLKNKFKSNFTSFMYGKPVYVHKLLDISIKGRSDRVFKVDCMYNGRKTKVSIPNAFPTFFSAI